MSIRFKVIFLVLCMTSAGALFLFYQDSLVASSKTRSSSSGAEESTEELLKARRALIDKKCQDPKMRKHYRSSGPARLYVDLNHRLMYCYIPKVACTYLKRLLMVISKTIIRPTDPQSIPREMVHEKNPMPKIEPYDDIEIAGYGMSNFTKFLFVRHPFERLVSAYRDKFLSSSNETTVYQQRIGKDIIRQYRTNASESSLANGNDVTFPEFVRYILDRWVSRRELDVHWRPMVDLCLPCNINYKIIGHFETLEDDIDLIMQKVNDDDSLAKYRQPTGPITTTVERLKKSMDQLSPALLSGLFRLYNDDFKLFGYQYPLNVS